MTTNTTTDTLTDKLAALGFQLAFITRLAGNRAGWPSGARHYRVRLVHTNVSTGDTVTLYDGIYSKGSALPDGVNLDEVIYSILSDAQCYDSARFFDDFIDELGYPMQTRHERKTARDAYDACRDAYDAWQRLPTSVRDDAETILEDY